MFDCIIIGAGFAGSYLASLLKDMDVLVIEKDKKLLPKDSGLVSSGFKDFFDDFIKEEITEMSAISPSGLSFSLKSEKPFAYLLERNDLLRHLRRSARENAKIRYETVKKINYSKNCVNVQTDYSSYDCKMLVGCDGALSIVRKSLGAKPMKCYAGIICRAKIESDIKIHFNKYFSPDFFSWIMSGEYGLVTAIRPLDYFEYFKKMLDLPDGKLFANPIPIGYTKSYGDRTLLVGDSCGQVKPLTGGGIIFSLIACRYAALTVKNAFIEGRFDKSFLGQYEKMWKRDFGREIKMQLFLRKIYRNLTNKEVDNLFKDFGRSIENLGDFDYDRFTNSWRKLPRMKLLKFLITKFPRAF